jgi:hypothetical protein
MNKRINTPKIVELCPFKTYVKVLTHILVNLTSFGNRVFADGIKLR